MIGPPFPTTWPISGVPENDLCSGAIVITSLPFTDAQNIAAATHDDGVDPPNTLNGNACASHGLYYTWTAPTNMTVITDLVGTQEWASSSVGIPWVKNGVYTASGGADIVIYGPQNFTSGSISSPSTYLSASFGGADAPITGYPEIAVANNLHTVSGTGPSGEDVVDAIDTANYTSAGLMVLGIGSLGDRYDARGPALGSVLHAQAQVKFKAAAFAEQNFAVPLALISGGDYDAGPLPDISNYIGAFLYVGMIQAGGQTGANFTWYIQYLAPDGVTFDLIEVDGSTDVCDDAWHELDVAVVPSTVTGVYGPADLAMGSASVASDGSVTVTVDGVAVVTATGLQLVINPRGRTSDDIYYGRGAGFGDGGSVGGDMVGPATGLYLYYNNTGSCGGPWATVAVASNNNAPYNGRGRIQFNAVEGTTYVFHAGALDSVGSLMAILVFNLFEAPSTPSNDLCVNAIAVTDSPYVNVQDTIGATVSVDDPVEHLYWGERMRGVWYTFTPSVTGDYVVDSLGSDYETLLSLWSTGTCGSIGGELAADANFSTGSAITATLTGGVPYRIQVAHTEDVDLMGGTLVLRIGTVVPASEIVSMTVGTGALLFGPTTEAPRRPPHIVTSMPAYRIVSSTPAWRVITTRDV